MDFGGSLFGKSPRALVSALVASVALVFALLAGNAEAELITPEAATPPPPTVPQAANAAPPPAAEAPPTTSAPSEPASSPESSQPDSTGAPQGAPSADTVDGDSPRGDAPVISLGYRVMDLELSMESLGGVTYSLLHLQEQVNGARDSVRELIANAEVLQKSIKELLDSMQHPEPNPADPAKGDGPSPEQSDTAPETSDQTDDPSSGPDAGAPDSGGPSNDGSGSAGAGDDGSGSASPSGDGSGGGTTTCKEKKPDGDPALCPN